MDGLKDIGVEYYRDRDVDIVFCVNVTAGKQGLIYMFEHSMGFDFHVRLNEALMKHKTYTTTLRIKFIFFRDYEFGDAMTISRFYELPNEMVELASMIKKAESYGGSDEGANGLEALYYAFKSDWTIGRFNRQITVLLTDSDALDLKERKNCPDYPSDMVDLDGLIKYWNYMDDGDNHLRDKTKRLIMYAPPRSKYESLCWQLNRCAFRPVEQDNDLHDLEFDDLMDEIIEAIISR